MLMQLLQIILIMLILEINIIQRTKKSSCGCFQFVDKRGPVWSYSEPLFDFLLDLKQLERKVDLSEVII
jgi:hypothetical protein